MSGSTTPSNAAGVPDGSAAVRRLSEVLLASVTALAAAGDPEKACRLAGQACVVLRDADPAAGRRVDALLHRPTPMLTW